MERFATLLVIAIVSVGGDAGAQYHGERMAPPLELPPLTEWVGYDIYADATAAQARVARQVRRERLETAIRGYAFCTPLCAVPVEWTSTYALPSPRWLPECLVNCLGDATGWVPSSIWISNRRVPRSGPGHPRHPPLRKRIERLRRLPKLP